MVQPSFDLTHKVLVIAGPTASGKSALALAIAQQHSGEIICADSRQVYSGMRIGTAGPSEEEMHAIPHHGFHTLDPLAALDAGKFLTQTDRFVADVRSRGNLPILVGGTGLYLRSYRYGLMDVPPKNEVLRSQLIEEARSIGLQTLHERLRALDPLSADAISANDEVRIVRALEIAALTGERPSDLRKSHTQDQPPRVDAQWILLWPQREWLMERIAQRAAGMFDEGLVEEALQLRDHIGSDHPLMHTMGYAEALLLADGTYTYAQALETVTIRQRQYAKRQMTWFQKEPWWTRVELPDARG